MPNIERIKIISKSYKFIFNPIVLLCLAFAEWSIYEADYFGIKYIIIPDDVIKNKDGSIPALDSGIIKKNPYYKEFYRYNDAVILKKIE